MAHLPSLPRKTLFSGPRQVVQQYLHAALSFILRNRKSTRPAGRDRWLASQTEALDRLGFFAEELDLREYFDDAVWINGGNAFPYAEQCNRADSTL
jgi:hypothetical protein